MYEMTFDGHMWTLERCAARPDFSQPFTSSFKDRDTIVGRWDISDDGLNWEARLRPHLHQAALGRQGPCPSSNPRQRARKRLPMTTRLSGPAAPRLPAHLVPSEVTALGADLHWEGLLISGDFSRQVAEDPEISGCRVTRCSFVNTEFVRARLSDTVVERCDLSAGALTLARLTRVEFNDCRLWGTDFSGVKMSDVQFRECRLVEASFRQSSGDRVRFERCDLTNADLYAAQFPGSCFFDSDLTGAELSQASLAKARMHGSTLEALRGAVSLRGTTISSVQLVPVALQVLAVLEINVDDERDPGTG